MTILKVYFFLIVCLQLGGWEKGYRQNMDLCPSSKNEIWNAMLKENTSPYMKELDMRWDNHHTETTWQKQAGKMDRGHQKHPLCKSPENLSVHTNGFSLLIYLSIFDLFCCQFASTTLFLIWQWIVGCINNFDMVINRIA